MRSANVFLLLSATALALASCSRAAHPSAKITWPIHMVSVNGESELIVENAGGRYHLAPANYRGPPPADGFGGSVKDCSDSQFACVNLEPTVLAVPRDGALPPTWHKSGSDFAVIRKLINPAGERLLIRASSKGVNYMTFTYSRDRGIENLSQFASADSWEIANTFLLADDVGLLAK